jgi:two-component sensor histidine kinase
MFGFKKDMFKVLDMVTASLLNLTLKYIKIEEKIKSLEDKISAMEKYHSLKYHEVKNIDIKEYVKNLNK